MALDPLVLDDLDWAALTDAARRRLPAVSAGKWTLHAPVDPGVTLVELFAWLLDQRLYRMDRVPEPFFRAAVALLGEAMRPVRAARTVFKATRSDSPSYLEAGTALVNANGDPGPIFAVEEEIELLDVRRVGLRVPGGGGGASDVDHENDLLEARGVTMFSADGRGAEARIVLYLPAPPSGPTSRPFTLFLDLLAPPKVRAEWHSEAADAAPPATLTWSYSRGPALPPGSFAPPSVRDGTGGLRRPGILRLPVPSDWAPEGPPVGGLHPFAIIVRTDAATFTFPVSVRRIVPNAVIAAHRRSVSEEQSVAWLPLPGLAIDLAETSAPPIPDEVRLSIREVDGDWHDWQPVQDFARWGPEDRVCRVDRARRRITFGDGLTGRIPRPFLRAGLAPGASEPNVRVALTAGGGPTGNLDAELHFVGDVASDLSAITLVEAEGGLDAETIDDARLRISGLLERIERAVTASDHETLAEGTPGVAIARARAAIGFHPGFPCTPVPGAVTVFVVPWAPRGDAIDPDARVGSPMPDPGALGAVRARLESARTLGTEVWVCPPRYRTVRLAVRVLGDPVDPYAMRRDIDAALRRFLDPLVGGDDHAGWPFGGRIDPSVLMRESAAEVGDGEIESVAIGLDGEAPSQDCEGIALGPHDLPALADVAVAFASDRRARSGGLR